MKEESVGKVVKGAKIADFEGVQLIEDYEVFTLGSMDTTHYEVDYRRIPKSYRAKILKKYTTIKKGTEVIDIASASTIMLKWMIIDFRGLFTRDKETRARIDHKWDPILTAKLPEEVQTEILEAGGANLGEFKGDMNAVDVGGEKN